MRLGRLAVGDDALLPPAISGSEYHRCCAARARRSVRPAATPSSMRLASFTSSSPVRSGTLPISFRYMRTGSGPFPESEPSSATSFEVADGRDRDGRLTEPRASAVVGRARVLRLGQSQLGRQLGIGPKCIGIVSLVKRFLRSATRCNTSCIRSGESSTVSSTGMTSSGVREPRSRPSESTAQSFDRHTGRPGERRNALAHGPSSADRTHATNCFEASTRVSSCLRSSSRCLGQVTVHDRLRGPGLGLDVGQCAHDGQTHQQGDHVLRLSVGLLDGQPAQQNGRVRPGRVDGVVQGLGRYQRKERVPVDGVVEQELFQEWRHLLRMMHRQSKRLHLGAGRVPFPCPPASPVGEQSCGCGAVGRLVGPGVAVVRAARRPGVAATAPRRSAGPRRRNSLSLVRSWSGVSRQRSAICIRYWSRTKSLGCSATASIAAAAALARPSGARSSARVEDPVKPEGEERPGLRRPPRAARPDHGPPGRPGSAPAGRAATTMSTSKRFSHS